MFLLETFALSRHTPLKEKQFPFPYSKLWNNHSHIKSEWALDWGWVRTDFRGKG